MKKQSVFLLLLLLPFLSFSESFDNIRYIWDFGSIELSNDDALIVDDEERTETTYKLVEISKVPFLVPSDLASPNILFLHNEYFAFIFRTDKKGELENIIALSKMSLKEWDAVVSGFYGEYVATSYLKEGEISYSAENLRGWEFSNKPWVEGVPGFGIGEKIFYKKDSAELGFSSDEGLNMKMLIISNGYVSFNNPNLYEKNSRVKTVRISNKAKDFDYIVDLKDTPNPQLIELPKATPDVIIEIRDIYKGSAWDDTCLNFLLSMPESSVESLK